VKLLIRHGADVNVVADRDHAAAVLQAAALGNCAIVQLLLDAGATLDAELVFNANTLCCNRLNDAAAVKVVKLLLAHCSSFVEESSELAAKMLSKAVDKGKLQVAQSLHAAGADVRPHSDRLMHDAAASGNLALVKWLQSLGLDARALSGESQMLPLHCACEYKHLHIVKYLLAVPGAADDVHARSAAEQTPLHTAAKNGADSIVQLLLERGADVDARDVKDNTALMIATSVQAVKLLLAAGADAAAVGDNGQTTLHCQAQCADPTMLLQGWHPWGTLR
jgi:ankyrin repeat protein